MREMPFASIHDTLLVSLFGKHGFRIVAREEERNAQIIASSNMMKYSTFGRRKKINELDKAAQL
jgi:hypothetical protein